MGAGASADGAAAKQAAPAWIEQISEDELREFCLQVSEDTRGRLRAALEGQEAAAINISTPRPADEKKPSSSTRAKGTAIKSPTLTPRGQKEAKHWLKLVRADPFALEGASTELKADRSFVLDAVKQNGNTLKHASEVLQADREVVLVAVKKTGSSLRHAVESLRAEREVVLAAVRQDGRALQYASKDLKADTGIVMAAVQQNSSTLQYASAELRGDREFIRAAVQSDDKKAQLVGGIR